MIVIASQITGFNNLFKLAIIEKTPKLRNIVSLWIRSIGDQWIFLKKDHQRGKRFDVNTSINLESGCENLKPDPIPLILYEIAW